MTLLKPTLIALCAALALWAAPCQAAPGDHRDPPRVQPPQSQDQGSSNGSQVIIIRGKGGKVTDVDKKQPPGKKDDTNRKP